MKRAHPAALAFLASLVLLLASCELMQVPAPATFNERAAAALTATTAAREAGTTLLLAGKISADDAENVLRQTDLAREGINIARTMHETDPTGADSRLSSVVIGLKALQAYLNTRGSP